LKTIDNNSKIIEIIGPPGIGKTTIYEALCKTWRPINNWIYQDALLTPKPNFTELNKWVEYRFRKIFGKKISKNIPVEYGLRFVGDHQDLANFYWDLLSNTQTYTNREIDKRFRSAHFLFKDFCRYQAIMESPSTRPCIINEGLLQKSFFINNDEQIVLDSISKYIPLVPLPHAIININVGDKNVIIGRLRSRNKVIASHVGKDNKALLVDIERWQFLLSIVLEKVQRKNVPIYHLDGEKPINENVLFINNLFKQQYSSS
jgi:hypothetical protein